MENLSNKQIFDKVNEALEKIRPYLIADGGNVSLEEVTPELDVKVKLTGACETCPFSLHTLKAGVEQAIRQEVPQVNNVVAV